MPRASNAELQRRYERIHDNIVYLKEHSGKNSAEVASYVGICHPVFLKRLDNPKTFTLENLDMLARLFNVKLETILNGKVCIETIDKPALNTVIKAYAETTS